ncbi:MAG: RnfH family protein [Pseudomonas sp.]|nr:RnfH family protein [Pseudomonas sp.]
MDKTSIGIEVAYALAERQKILRLQVPRGTTVRQAAMLSGLDSYFPGLDLSSCALGIFGKTVSQASERPVQEGERIEIYRPLLADPKEVRKQRAEKAAKAKALGD